jgi:succinyl-CoA synthetase beta subunit
VFIAVDMFAVRSIWSGAGRLLVQQPRRFLNLHEYQSKQLLEQYGVTCQRWKLATNVEDARAAAQELCRTGAKELVVKAQVHAGGRGKGKFETGFQGGVHLTKDPEAAVQLANNMLHHRLITKQTGAKGALVNSVMIAESLNFAHEFYFAILMDRKYNGPVMIGSPFGGMDIEEVAEKHPDQIFVQPIDIETGLQSGQALEFAKKIGFGELSSVAAGEIERIYDLFIKKDATQVEINPFVITDLKKVVSIDAKMNFDDNAEFRQQSLFQMHDPSEDDEREVAASKHQLQYVGLDGNIGCLVNGAGLAMATMDIVKLLGGNPANFCDLGGGATEDRVTAAIQIISSDPQVKVIFVNIFGGIVRCDAIARGMIAASRFLTSKIPLVVRLQGTNVDIAEKLIAESKLPIHTAQTLGDAARIAVSLSPK